MLDRIAPTDVEQRQDLVEHSPMLSCDANARADLRRHLAKPVDHRRQLDGLWPRAKDGEDFEQGSAIISSRCSHIPA